MVVVNDAFELRGLMTVKDITKQPASLNAARDSHGGLRVGAAVAFGEDTEERVDLLVKAGVDAIIVDTAHGHSAGVLERVRWVKSRHPHVDVIGGNIATGAAALALVEAGRRRRSGRHRPGFHLHDAHRGRRRRAQITAIDNVVHGAEGHRRAVIADGACVSRATSPRPSRGCRLRDDGRRLRWHRRSAGRGHPHQGRTFKSYRGMAAWRHGQGSADRYFQEGGNNPNTSKLVPEGIEARCPLGARWCRSSPDGGRPEGFHALPWLRHDCRDVQGRVRRDHLGGHARESHVHDVQITASLRTTGAITRSTRAGRHHALLAFCDER